MGDDIQINTPQPCAHNESPGLSYVQNDIFVLAYQIENLDLF